MKTSKHMWQRCLSVLLVLVMVAAFILPNIQVSAADTDADLWIDPVNGSDTNDGTTEAKALKTIQAAKSKAAELSESKDVVVILKAGTYDASETIVFGAEDSGKNGHTITYRAASGEKAIISGGASLDGWTLHDADKNIYVTDVPAGAELARSFYVDGKVQTMAYIENSPIDWQVLSTGGYRSPYVTSADNHEYLILDLGEDKLISGLTLYAGSERAADGNAAGFPKDFTIQTSSDGVHWSTQVNEVDCVAPIARSAKSFEFPAVGARYIKLDVTKLGNTARNSADKYHMALSEILVGLTGKEAALNLNMVQHVNMDSPVTTVSSATLTANNGYVIELGTDRVAVAGIALNASALDGIRGDLKIEASADGSSEWYTVLSKKNYQFSDINDIAFNPVVAAALRITLSVDTVAEVKAYAPASLAISAVAAAGQNGNKLTDGKFDGIYTGPSYMTPVAGSSDIVIDLGSVQDVGAVRMYPTYEGGKAVGYLKAARILVSKDGENYTTALEMANIADPDLGAQLLLLDKGAKARYIKIQPLLLTSAGNDYRLQLQEIEVLTTKVEVNENDGPIIAYKDIYTPISLANATPVLGYYADVNDLSGLPIDHQVAPGEDACVIDKKSNSYGYSGLFKYNELVAHGGVKVPAFYLELSAATPVNTIDIVMDGDLWGVPKSYEVQFHDGTEWITVAEATDVVWSKQNYIIHAEFETINATAARILAYDLYLTDGTYPEDMSTNMETSTRFILNEFNPQLKTQVPYEIEINTDAPTVEYNKVPLSASNVLGYGYYRPGWEEVTEHAADNGGKMFDGDKDTYSATRGQQYQWLPPVGGNSPVILLDASKTNNGNPVNINAIELTIREDGRCAPYNYVIQVTTEKDVDNWITIADETEKDWTTKREELYKFSPLDVYKVRVVADMLTPEANISIEECAPSVTTYMHISELTLLNISDPTNPVADNLCTQGENASGNQEYHIELVEALNDNDENTYNANKAADGYIDPANEIGFVVPEKYNFDELRNPANVEMHTLYLWYHSMYHFTGVSGDGTEIYLETGLMPTWIANDYQFIDSVGEWYIDREEGKIYYKADGTMNGKEAILPIAEQIIQMDYADNIKFEGITFSHTTWTHCSTENYDDQQANCYYDGAHWVQAPAGILLTGCTGITFDDCDLTNMGTAALKIRSDGDKTSDGNSVINSRIHDIGYGGIILGQVNGHHGYQSYMLVKNTTIKNNYITRCGLENRDSPGIIATYTNGTVIEHNEVAYMPYTGISTGWGWDSEEANGNQVFMDEVGNNKVIYNYVHDTSKNNRDGGSIYNLGSSKGSEVAYNYIINSWDGDDVFENGLYLDQGSAFIEVHHNVVGENVGYWMHQWMSTIHDNVWHDNFYVDTKSRDNGTNNQAYDNTKVDKQEDLYEHAEAVEIMENAGLLDDSVKASVWEGFAPMQNVVQEFWPGENSRYIEPSWGWDDVAINGQVGRTIYDSIKKRVNINVKEDTDVTALALIFTLYDGWTCDKVSGSVQDFSEPVVYTLSDGKGNTVEWTVNVKKQVDSGGEIPGEEINLGTIISGYEPGQWTVDPVAGSATAGVLHFSDYSGYTAQYFGESTIFLFDMQIDVDGNTGLAALSLNNQDPTVDWDDGSTEYMINFYLDTIEVQKFVGGQRTVYFGEQADHNAVYGTLPNNFFTPGEVHSIKTGAINTDEGGVRLFLYVDGNLVFDFVDTEDPIRDGGHFALYAQSQVISLRGHSDINKTPDRSELEWALYVVDSLDVHAYKQATWGQLQNAVVTVNEILASYGGVTQEMVNQCTMILWEALNALEQTDGTQGAIIPDRPLEPGEIDWTAFNTAYDMLMTLDLSIYTEDSIYALYDVIDMVNAVLDAPELTQEMLDEVTALLIDAINNLEPIDDTILPPIVRPDGLDYTYIDAALKVAFSAKEQNYSAATYAALQDAIANAYAVMSNMDCTQAEVDAAYIALVDAIKALEYIGAGLEPIIPPIRVPGADEPTVPGDTDTDVPGDGDNDTDVPGDGDNDGDTTPPGKTGDDFMLVGLIVLLVIGMAGAAAAVVLLKKKEAR